MLFNIFNYIVEKKEILKLFFWVDLFKVNFSLLLGIIVKVLSIVVVIKICVDVKKIEVRVV